MSDPSPGPSGTTAGYRWAPARRARASVTGGPRPARAAAARATVTVGVSRHGAGVTRTVREPESDSHDSVAPRHGSSCPGPRDQKRVRPAGPGVPARGAQPVADSDATQAHMLVGKIFCRDRKSLLVRPGHIDAGRVTSLARRRQCRRAAPWQPARDGTDHAGRDNHDAPPRQSHSG